MRFKVQVPSLDQSSLGQSTMEMIGKLEFVYVNKTIGTGCLAFGRSTGNDFSGY